MNYKLIKNISKGSFSKCNLYSLNNTHYAIKKNIENEECIITSDLKELYCLSILNKHPYIIKIHEVFFDNKNIFNLVYNYYPITLRQFITNKSFTKRLDFFTSFCSQLLSAVHYIHINDIIHTDLKTDNILIDNYKIKVIDFGSSIIETITKKDPNVSTYTIRAPEIYKYDCTYSNKIDIWSTGVLIYNYYYNEEVIDINPDLEEFSNIRLKQIQLFCKNFDIFVRDETLNKLLKDMIKFDEVNRFDINQCINNFEKLYLIKVEILTKFKILKFKRNDKLFDLNAFICDRLGIYIFNLNVGYKILDSYYFPSDLDLISIWYINYILYLPDCEQNTKFISFIPLFNSYFKKIFNEYRIKKYIRKNINKLFNLINSNY